MHVRPVTGDTVAVKLTPPLKPWNAVTVIVEVPEALARTVTLVGFAANAKS